MRTTIDMKPEHRAKLLEIAAHRGVKGFSRLASEALGVLLTRNRRHFERAPGLALDRLSRAEADWVGPGRSRDLLATWTPGSSSMTSAA